MRRKYKYAMIDDYIALIRIIYICKVSELVNDNYYYNKNSNLTLMNLENSALDLKNKYEDTFQKLKICDVSYILLRSQLNSVINKNYENNRYQKLTFKKLNDLNNRLKLLDIHHNVHLLKIK